MSEHTPTPWTAGDILYLAYAKDVDFAVRACNSYDGLLTALKQLETVARSHCRILEGEEPGYDLKDVLSYCNEAQIAIKNAEEK